MGSSAGRYRYSIKEVNVSWAKESLVGAEFVFLVCGMEFGLSFGCSFFFARLFEERSLGGDRNNHRDNSTFSKYNLVQRCYSVSAIPHHSKYPIHPELDM